MTADILNKIVAHKRELLARKKDYFDIIRQNTAPARMTRYQVFRDAIAKPGRLNLIAEIKKASPSRGLIREDFDAAVLARIYEAGGADALSVLTEDKFFLGKPAYLRTVSRDARIPVLQKDFIVDDVQIYQAHQLGASAVLLIVAILSDGELQGLLATAARLDLDGLVEVHDEAELDRALAAGAEIIGINNRDLRTFSVDLNTGLRLAPMVPKEKITVIESGITTPDDIRRVAACGANAVLIGETFLRAADVGAKMREVMGQKERN